MIKDINKESYRSENTAHQNVNKFDLILGPGEGMSKGTVRFIIDRNLPEDIAKLYDLKDLKKPGSLLYCKNSLIGQKPCRVSMNSLK